MKNLVAFLLLFVSPLAMAQWGTPTHVGDCYAPYIERDAIRKAAFIMGVPQRWVSETIVFCDPWTPLSGSSLTFQRIGQRTVNCTSKKYWIWWVGCINGTVVGNKWTVVLRMHPNVSQFMVTVAQQQGMSLGSRTEEEIRCFYGLESHIVGLVIHEWNHRRGYDHGPAMTAEDGRLKTLYMQRYGAWVRANEWALCSPKYVRSVNEN